MATRVEIDQARTHRLVPAEYASPRTLARLELPYDVLADLNELDTITDGRKIAEAGGNSSIGTGELLQAVPEAQIVNAAYAHPGPYGGRFHTAQRGAWYAGYEIETSIAEVAFHKRHFLAEGRIQERRCFDYVDFLADFSGSFHTLDTSEQEFCLRAEPIPSCYQLAQALATALLFRGSNGIVYPSVRRPGGSCIVCFRPALVFYPRRSRTYQITIDPVTGSFTSEVVLA